MTIHHCFSCISLTAAARVLAGGLVAVCLQSGLLAAGGALTGTVTIKGDPPKPKMISIAGQKDYLATYPGKTEIEDKDVIVGEGGALANAFVYISKGLSKADLKKLEFEGDEKVLIDQVNCFYTPRVVGIQVGQTLAIRNSDDFTHNVRSFPTRNRPFNFGMPAGSPDREKEITKKENGIEMSCDFHKDMKGYVFSMEHPFFAVTGEDGTFEITGIPDGEYDVKAWHERFKELRVKDVKIKDGQATTLDFTFESE